MSAPRRPSATEALLGSRQPPVSSSAAAAAAAAAREAALASQQRDFAAGLLQPFLPPASQAQPYRSSSAQLADMTGVQVREDDARRWLGLVWRLDIISLFILPAIPVLVHLSDHCN